MRIKLTLSVALAFGVAAISPLAAQEVRTSNSAPVRESVPMPLSSTTTVDTRQQGSYRVALVEPAPAKRCDTLLCPMFLVLGSGF